MAHVLVQEMFYAQALCIANDMSNTSLQSVCVARQSLMWLCDNAHLLLERRVSGQMNCVQVRYQDPPG